jgi:hypothetical protein
MARVYRIKDGVKKLQDMQDSVWATILKEGAKVVPEGVTYELAPAPNTKAVELMPQEEKPTAEVKETRKNRK